MADLAGDAMAGVAHDVQTQAKHVLVIGPGYREALVEVELRHVEAVAVGVVHQERHDVIHVAVPGAAQHRQGRQGQAADHRLAVGRADRRAAHHHRRGRAHRLLQLGLEVLVAGQRRGGQLLCVQEPLVRIGHRLLRPGGLQLDVERHLFDLVARGGEAGRLVVESGDDQPRGAVVAAQGHHIVGVGEDVADHLVARRGVGGELAHGRDEGGILKGHDGRIGDHALLQLVLLGPRSDAQGRAHRRPVREGRADGAGAPHVGCVGAGLTHDVVGQDRRPDRQGGLDGRRRWGRRFLLLAERKGRGGPRYRQPQDQGGSHYSKA